MSALPVDLTSAVVLGIGLLVLFIVIRVVLKITHVLFTIGCLALIVLAVVFVLLGGAANLLPGA